jgi:molybdate transport system substrate-binding protein
MSLDGALHEINAAYARHEPGTLVELNLAGSGALQQQVERGAPVDVFISAAASQMDALDRGGFIVSESRVDLLGNAMALVALPNAGAPKGFSGLAEGGIRTIAIGDPKSVPAGRYAMEIFAHYGLTAIAGLEVIPARDVRTVLTYVETGNVDAGVVYLTDAKASRKVVVLEVAAAASHQPVIYPAAVIRATRHAARAGAYLAFLQTADAAGIFRKWGFTPLGAADR